MMLARLMVLVFVMSSVVSHAAAPNGEIIGQWDLINNGQTRAKISADGSTAMLPAYIDPILGIQNGVYDVATGTFTAIRQEDSGGVLQNISAIYDISGNGSVVVGRGINNEPITWNATTGVSDLTGLSGETIHGYATNISDDGSIIYGWNSDTSSAFRWTASEGYTYPLGSSDQAYGNRITDISSNGSAVVGVGYNGNVITGFLWSDQTGFHTLSALPVNQLVMAGGFVGYALGMVDGSTYIFSDQGLVSQISSTTPWWMSTDGSLLFGSQSGNLSVGSGEGFWGSLGFKLWTKDSGIVPVNDYFASLGYQVPAPYQIGPVFGVSDDKKTFLVGGYYGGTSYAIIHVPEVNSLAFFAMALPFFIIVARRVRRSWPN